MDHHASGFVDDDEVIIFVDDFERDVFRNGAQRRSLRRIQDFNVLVPAETQRRFGGGVIDEDLFRGDELLNAGAAGFFEMRDEKLVETFAGVFGGDRERDGEIGHSAIGTWHSAAADSGEKDT